MKKGYPSREEAERILNESARGTQGRWPEHSRTCAMCAEKIAAAAGMDPDKAYVLGLLHDIGRRNGPGQLAHVYFGWKYMDELGWHDCAKICLTHSFSVQEIRMYAGRFDITEEQQKEMNDALTACTFDEYDWLIQLCDAISGASGVMTIENRLGDIAERYNGYPQEKWDRVYELKEYFEKRMGADLYQITCGGKTSEVY